MATKKKQPETAEVETVAAVVEETPVEEPATNRRVKAAQMESDSFTADRLDRDYAATQHLENRDARQEEATTVAVFTNALKQGTILNSVIAGVETNGANVYWVCYHGSITVMIPFTDSFMTLPAELLAHDTAAIITRRRQFLSKSIGAEIPFVVTSFGADPNGGYIATGSRTTALARIRQHYFGTNASRELKEGMTIEAQILSLGPHSCFVTACGLDIPVRNHELSHRYIEDVAADFYVGQRKRFRVMSINEQPNTIPEVKLSALPVELEYYAPNLKRIRPHSRYGAIVTSLRQEKNKETPGVVVNMFLEGVDVPAFSRVIQLRIQDELHTGDKVIFEATGIVKNGYAHGKIVRYVTSR